MTIAFWLLLALATFLVTVTLLPLLKHPAWWVRIWDFPRLQLALLSLAGLLLSALLVPASPAGYALIACFVATLLYQTWWILPYTPLWKKEVHDAPKNDASKAQSSHKARPHLKIMSCNVLTPNRESAKLLALIEQYQPDVFVLLETDDWWQRQMQPIDAAYPHRVAVPLDNLYGMHVYSRLALSHTEVSYLVEHDVPSIHASVHVNQDLVVRMHFLHPAPPSPIENEESTERDVELLMVAKSLQDENTPIIVTGDLNDVAWSPTTRLFRKISRLLDPRVGRGMFNSFHASYPFARWPLDHFFHSDHFQVVRIERLPSMGSDHFPVFLELQYHPENDEIQEGLQADAADQQEAEEKLAQEGADPDDVPEPVSKG